MILIKLVNDWETYRRVMARSNQIPPEKLLVTALVGAAIGLTVGFGLYAAYGAGQEFVVGFPDWIIDRWNDSLVWAGGGACVALGLRYIIR